MAAFVLGWLGPEEAAEARRHLTSCSECQDELEELQEVDRALEAASPLVEPPLYLKDEILSRIRAEKHLPPHTEKTTPLEGGIESTGALRPGRSWNFRTILPGAAAAIAAVIAIVFILSGLLREEAPVASIQLIPTPQEAKELEGYWGVAELRPQSSSNLRVDLRLNNFGEPEADSFYQVWFVSGERRISAGSFASAGEGETRVRLNVASQARSYDAVIITEESLDDGPPPGGEAALEGKLP